ncbi:hypothetical protein C0995_004756 [Termitomyces sp. Mi166|nr:hypothetical protein C0995_004756 [Termitomyces sp. Mi166\
MAQLAFMQKRDEACADLFYQALEKEKHVASPPQPSHKLKKAHQTNPCCPLASGPRTRALVLPYSEDDVPQSEDQMDKSEDFLSLAAPGLTTSCAHKIQGAAEPVSKKAKKAEHDKPVAMVPVGFSHNVVWEADEGLVRVHESMTYTYPLAYAAPALLINQVNSNNKEVIMSVLVQEAG